MSVRELAIIVQEIQKQQHEYNLTILDILRQIAERLERDEE